MGILIVIHAPDGVATIAIEGDAEFGTATVDPLCFPACTVKAWNKSRIEIGNTVGDAANPGGHFAIHSELRSAPLSRFALKLSCSTGASMWYRLDGETRKNTCPPNSNRTYPYFGLVGGAVSNRNDDLADLFPSEEGGFPDSAEEESL